MADEKQKKEQNKEIDEKKEKFLETGNKKKTLQKGPPIYFMISLLVLGILLGAAAIMVFMPAQEPTGNGNIPDTNTNDVAYKTVPVTMIYSDECNSCRQTNTFEELLVVRQIPYTMNKVEASSDEGQELINKFGITTLPTALIDAEKIQFYPSTKKNFDNVLKQKLGVYIAPEMNLNENMYFPIYFVEPIGGLCNSEKPTIIQFDDYYATQNTAGKETQYGFWDDFNSTTELKYSFAQTQASSDQNAVLANLFLMCASQQGKYHELEKAITGIYCNNTYGKGDESLLTAAEIAGCSTISGHYGTPLTQIELDIALNRTSIDQNAFKQCIDNKEVAYTNAMNLAKEAQVTRIGTFLLDCRETASLSELRDSFCARHPEQEACNATSEEQ